MQKGGNLDSVRIGYTLPMLYGNYTNEAAFRKDFVAPFLRRMGFEGVQETHGNNEFGCDFICWELHRIFGHRHYAVVVKHHEKLSQGTLAQAVLVQIRQAFAKPIKTSFSPRDVRASVVIVLNSGSISENARQEIWNDLAAERYGDNVVMLDGNQLAAVSQFAQAGDAKRSRGLLIGLRAELLTTMNNIGVMIESVMIQGRFEPLPILTRNLESLTSTPELHEKITLHNCVALLNDLTILRTRAKRFVAPVGISTFSRVAASEFQRCALSIRSELNRMLAQVEAALQSLT